MTISNQLMNMLDPESHKFELSSRRDVLLSERKEFYANYQSREEKHLKASCITGNIDICRQGNSIRFN
jgi:hypothetical protein